MKRKICAVFLSLVMLMTGTVMFVSALSVPFSDIWDLDEYTQNNIQYLYDEGIMNGTSATTFSPHDYYTRAMFVTMLGRMMGVNPSDYSYSPFWDVPAGRWDAPYIAWASQNGIVNGIGGGQFNPTGIITLEQYSAIICRFWRQAGFTINYYPNFDAWPPVVGNLYEASEYAQEDMKDLIDVGLISWQWRYADNSRSSIIVYIEPKKLLTRDWIAKWFGDFHYILNYDESVYVTIDSDAGYEIETWIDW